MRQRLREIGHRVVVQEEVPGTPYFGRVNAIRIDPVTRLWHAATGPAWKTAAAGF